MNNIRIRIIRTNTKTTKEENIAFGYSDKKGRQIGAHIAYLEAEQLPASEDGAKWNYYSYFTGKAWGYRSSATRGGRGFGASQNACWYPSEELRDKAVLRYRKGAAQRAAKREGK